MSWWIFHTHLDLDDVRLVRYCILVFWKISAQFQRRNNQTLWCGICQKYVSWKLPKIHHMWLRQKRKGKEKNKHILVETITSGNRQLFWCGVAMLNLSITSVSAHTNTGNKNRKWQVNHKRKWITYQSAPLICTLNYDSDFSWHQRECQTLTLPQFNQNHII